MGYGGMVRAGQRGGWWTWIAALVVLSACSGREQDPAPVVYQGGDPDVASIPAAPATGVPDGRGIITYPDYAVVVANDGDTLDSIARRIGVPVAALASYNGLPATWRPRRGDTLVLPPDVTPTSPFVTEPPSPSPVPVPGAPVTTAPLTTAPDGTGWTPALAEAAIDRTGAATGSSGVPPLSAPGETGTDTAALEPLRHTVQPGETIYSVSRLYEVEVSELAAWNGMGRDYTIRPGQDLRIPPPGAAGLSESAVTAPGTTQPIVSPPSAADPLPPVPVPAIVPPSPNLDQYRSDAPSSVKLLVPVQGQIARTYARAGPNRNDGIDFTAPAGASVVAADDGEVALVSNSLGGAGKIVLIRHAGGLTTVYGRIDGLTVRKGDVVSRGQVIGSVADAATPALHFEVRRGAESVDPAGFL